MDSKSDLRVYAKELRKTLDIKNISSEIVSKIRTLNDYKKAENVMIFYPMKYEINLLDLLNDNKNFYLPKVEQCPLQTSDCHSEAENIMSSFAALKMTEAEDSQKTSSSPLLVCPYDKNLKKSKMGIYEPCTAPVEPNILDLIFVPALLVDKKGYRLGYGGGFYDRFLKQYPNIKTIVPIEKELMIDKLPHENFDIKISQIITQ